MARCNNDSLISKVGVKALNKTIEVDFAVLTDTENCVKINTRNYLQLLGEPAFNTFLTPPDMFACLADGCKNSGTLMLTSETGNVGAKFRTRMDATEYAAGVITYYVYFPESDAGGLREVTTTIADIADSNLHNADSYLTEVFVAPEGGFYPVVVDLCTYPNQSTVWEASVHGALIEISVDTEQAGFSSIFFYSSMEEFQVNDTVKVWCLDEFSGEFTLDARDASCFGVGYDPASVSIERTITGRSVTANYWKLNPLTKKGTLTKGWLPRTVELKVEQSNEFQGYGAISLVDINMAECGFLLASVAHDCRVTEGMLNRVNTPVPVTIENNQFIVLPDPATYDESAVLLFNEALIGATIVVSYPQQVEAEHFVGNASDLDARRVRMSIVKEQTDGVKQHYVYNNVLVTSFPDSLSDEETTFDFTISVQRDRNGNFYDMFRVID